MDWTTDKFIDVVRKNILAVYNKKGHACYQKKQYDEAIEYYEMAIAIDPDDAYAYYGKGIVHYTVAYQDRNTALLEEAEEDFLTALDVDPNHAESKKQLKRLQQTMKKMGLR